MIILDTDIVTLLTNGDQAIVKFVRTQKQSDLAISVVTVEEMLQGWYGAIQKARGKKDDEKLIAAYASLKRAAEFCGKVPIVAFDKQCMCKFQEIVRVHRITKGMNDAKIAATAIATSATLVTRNARDYQIPGLALVVP